ncbi:4-hydroxybutyrate CoA-transferase [Sphingomonas koreensis]|uniref:4-hydroxybutyrate CoA-transferase n=1 Tax=Sphingomonas koreensis TaxID=93064 RepID=A0A430G219_9SPHN|nr:4-hydroxybutyrate CoA-transferase [Sphingomonas koreensis]
MLLSGCSADSSVLDAAIVAAGDAISRTWFSGIFVPGYNKCRWLANPHARALSFFMTPEQRAVDAARVDFRALRYADILSFLKVSRPSAILCMVSPPNAQGMCSFGTTVDFLADLWRSVPIRIAHINPMMPRTNGDPGIPLSELTAWCEAPVPLLAQEEGPADSVAAAIAEHILPLIPNGASIQTGLGKIPGSVLRGLTSHRDLRIHSGLIGDAVVDLLEAGALRPVSPVSAGVAIGSDRLYRAISSDDFSFWPVSSTHALDAFNDGGAPIAINSVIEVDLFGQGYAELTPKGFMSGPGGAIDFAHSVRVAQGVRIVALPSTAGGGTVSRIVPAGSGMGPVSLSRSEIDIVVTEHGAADLRYLSHEQRSRALVSIAHPDHRDDLERSWEVTSRSL